MIRLSVIIPVFGVESYISRCLDSVFKINLPESDYEVICIDDCSTDSSATIINGYKDYHHNLTLLRHHSNKRQGGARNTGIRFAKGEYIVFVDADDRIPIYDLPGLLDYMDENDLELLLGAAEVHKRDGEVLRWGNSPITESRIMTGPELFTEEYVHRIAFGVVWMGIYSINLVRRITPFLENVLYEDTDWTLRCAYNATLLQYKPIVVYNYMENDGSTTTSISISKLIARVKQGLRIWNWAQTTSINHNDVVTVAEDYCTWNLKCLKSLKFFSHSDRAFFYHSISNEEIAIMKQWRMGGKWMRIVKHPYASRIELFITSPLYRFARYMKKKINN
ncbi:MAG: glycosyltransferase family 2 protein [Bacteroidales bacterium]|nr:glycosyltransferase family 2 protein [Bacteroidales bacterium]